MSVSTSVFSRIARSPSRLVFGKDIVYTEVVNLVDQEGNRLTDENGTNLVAD